MLVHLIEISISHEKIIKIRLQQLSVIKNPETIKWLQGIRYWINIGGGENVDPPKNSKLKKPARGGGSAGFINIDKFRK